MIMQWTMCERAIYLKGCGHFTEIGNISYKLWYGGTGMVVGLWYWITRICHDYIEHVGAEF